MHSYHEDHSDSDSDQSVESQGHGRRRNAHTALGVAAPPQASELFYRLRQEAAKEKARELVAPLPLPAILASITAKVASMGPSDLIKHRRSTMELLRTRASSLLSATSSEINAADPGIQQVLRAASLRGVHISLFRELLSHLGWHDMAVIDDMLHGFRLVGNINTGERPGSSVRTATLSKRDLLLRAASFSPSLAARHRTVKFDAGDSAILQQTIDEILLGRMTPLTPVCPRILSGVVTRRFAVEQLTAKGLLKLRMLISLVCVTELPLVITCSNICYNIM